MNKIIAMIILIFIACQSSTGPGQSEQSVFEKQGYRQVNNFRTIMWIRPVGPDTAVYLMYDEKEYGRVSEIVYENRFYQPAFPLKWIWSLNSEYDKYNLYYIFIDSQDTIRSIWVK